MVFDITNPQGLAFRSQTSCLFATLSVLLRNTCRSLQESRRFPLSRPPPVADAAIHGCFSSRWSAQPPYQVLVFIKKNGCHLKATAIFWAHKDLPSIRKHRVCSLQAASLAFACIHARLSSLVGRRSLGSSPPLQQKNRPAPFGTVRFFGPTRT
jgi:hypothetical protein